MPKHVVRDPGINSLNRRPASRSGKPEILQNTKKITVAVICGGPSVEHEVSLWSAQNVVKACIEAGYEVCAIYVARDGRWIYDQSLKELLVKSDTTDILKGVSSVVGKSVAVVPAVGLICDGSLMSIDVAFPIIHGTMGEDGTIQGLLEIALIPYVGCGVSASAIGMDKAIAKALAEQAGVAVAPYIVATEENPPTYKTVFDEFGTPFFVKPASLGSSVGVSKVRTKQEYSDALISGFKVDNKLLIEKMIMGREIECALLTDGHNLLSGVGEVATTHDFYSFDAKYLDEKTVRIEVPATIPKEAVETIRENATMVADSLGLEGMSRIDFFYTETGEVVFNEVNTIPGFTGLSMYPRLWKHEGYTDALLVQALITHALDKASR